jgi:hypothetical protein
MEQTRLVSDLVKLVFPDYQKIILEQFERHGTVINPQKGFTSFDFRFLYRKGKSIKIDQAYEITQNNYLQDGIILRPDTMEVVNPRLPRILFLKEPKPSLQDIQLRIWLEMVVASEDKKRVTMEYMRVNFWKFARSLTSGIHYMSMGN